MEEQYKKENEERKNAINKQQEEYEKKLKDLQSKRSDTENETDRELQELHDKYVVNSQIREQEQERKVKEIQDEFTKHKLIEQNKAYLQHKLSKYLSQITEVNLIAKELNRNISFSVKLQNANIFDINHDKIVKPRILVQVTNREEKRRYLWDLKTFKNRYFMIKDELEKYYETNQLVKLKQENDPFWDPPEIATLAQAHLLILPIGHLLDIDVDLPLLNETGSIGNLKVRFVDDIDSYMIILYSYYIGKGLSQ